MNTDTYRSKRIEQIKEINSLIANGMSRKEAIKQVGNIAPMTYYKWNRMLERGEQALETKKSKPYVETIKAEEYKPQRIVAFVGSVEDVVSALSRM